MAEWAAFYALEPWGFHADDAMNAIGAHASLAAAGAKGVSMTALMLSEMRKTPDERREDMNKRIVAAMVSLGAKMPKH